MAYVALVVLMMQEATNRRRRLAEMEQVRSVKVEQDHETDEAKAETNEG